MRTDVDLSSVSSNDFQQVTIWSLFFFSCFPQPPQEDDGEPKFDPSGYDKDLVENLERDIVQKNPNVHW